MEINVSGGKTLPIPGLDFSSTRYNVEITGIPVRGNTTEDLLEAQTWGIEQLKVLEQKMIEEKIPEMIKANDRARVYKEFINLMQNDKDVGLIVKKKWNDYIELKKQQANQQ